MRKSLYRIKTEEGIAFVYRIEKRKTILEKSVEQLEEIYGAAEKSILFAIGRNFNKLHHKIQSDRTGNHLFELKKT